MAGGVRATRCKQFAMCRQNATTTAYHTFLKKAGRYCARCRATNEYLIDIAPKPRAKETTGEIRGRLGTHPLAVYTVKSKRPALVPGDKIRVRSKQDTRVIEWTEVRVIEIKGHNNVHMMEMA